ncbi:hypothetical protein GTCCBUS3UF5_28270 [Geobacillus thermoleovorans CCB_US3_UF5]|uniref:Uncharacterized protein n=3 Tax=Geobacillus thermoleovorans group TaxID=1505648 RepID=A0A2Z3NCB9_GEOTH|nr:hypothetical protein GTCCBUS3UF5_28270 [Geobacillus thermoleovorans CCB_US3_UF5]AUI37797.1 hypothetical protein CWI35_15850 [[Bacillus] caldolyticus]AWO75359.1 hypothetical protein C1N76_13150 [Geobacillus thermoleovorans]OQP17639.1 hypothetical protein B1693_02120 [Geobacillus zalihae]QCK84271.1 hypothetical protein E5Z46_16315 [Geobacillus kaustophilus NBRC 102445]TRY45086.1 hypothetical protein FOI67_02310 [Geobacillus sp. LEMMJ02]GAJ58120.1 hypothetical protein B23_1326 [Geobacillus th
MIIATARRRFNDERKAKPPFGLSGKTRNGQSRAKKTIDNMESAALCAPAGGRRPKEKAAIVTARSCFVRT